MTSSKVLTQNVVMKSKRFGTCLEPENVPGVVSDSLAMVKDLRSGCGGPEQCDRDSPGVRGRVPEFGIARNV